MKVSVVIPALNEEKTIGICVGKALKTIKALGLEGEVLVADNGSTDKTKDIAESLGARVVSISEKGYGNAYIGGFEEAKGEYLIMGDADDSYNFEEVEPYVKKLDEGYDFVMGNRFKGKIEKGAMPFLHRYLGTPVITFVMNLFFKTGIGDSNCGMRGLTKKAFQEMRLKASGMEFAAEMVVKASLVKLKIAEVPCNLYRDKRGRKPHLKTWQDGWRNLRFLMLFSPRWIFMVPGVTLLTLGAVGMISLLLRDVIDPGSWGFISQKHMLSFLLLFLVGSQVVGQGLAAQAFTFSKYFDQASKSMKFLQRHFNLEKGILSGVVLMFLSISVFLYLFISYYFRIFPFLTELVRFDIAILAIAGSVTGIQVIFTSFLLSLSYFKVK